MYEPFSSGKIKLYYRTIILLVGMGWGHWIMSNPNSFPITLWNLSMSKSMSRFRVLLNGKKLAVDIIDASSIFQCNCCLGCKARSSCKIWWTIIIEQLLLYPCLQEKFKNVSWKMIPWKESPHTLPKWIW